MPPLPGLGFYLKSFWDVYMRSLGEWISMAFANYVYDFYKLCSLRDSKQCKQLIQPDHCLHQLLPSERNIAM